MRYEIIVAAIVVVLTIIVGGYWYFYRTPEPAPEPAPAPVAEPTAKAPAITYTTVVAATPETAGSPALPGTTVISTAGGNLTQYGDETPVVEGDEHFQPYMSILTNDMYRSDAAFDPDLSKDEPEIYGNYI